MMAALLSKLSVDMGQELLAPDAHNVRGYFEDVEFLSLQRRMLSESCASDDGGHPDWGWTEHETLDRRGFERFVPEARSLLAARAERTMGWGWKDPRTSLLVEFWEPLLEGARYVLVYRFPWDVADSMQRLGADVFLRNPDYAYRIWEYYNRHVRDFYVAHRDRCLLVSSNALPQHLQAFTRAVRDKLGVQIREGGVDDLYDEDLLKTTADTDPLIDLVAAVWPQCARLLSELDELADVSGAGSWRARPVRSRLARPDADDGAPIDVSVVTPCYEQGVLLIEAIASAERTAPPNCELIIVNDGSRQPRTLEILDTLKGLGYFIVDQPNLGPSAARNAAIALARGRYILPLDDDNRLRAGFIRDAIQVLDAQPDVGVVYGDRHDFGLRTGTQQIPELDRRKLLEANYIDACAVFRKDIWVTCGGYDASVSPLEDWELWIQAMKRGWRFHHLPYATFDYRVRPDSLLARAQVTIPKGQLRNRFREKHAELYWPLSIEHLEELTRRLAEQASESERHVQAIRAEGAAISGELTALRERHARLEGEISRMKGSWVWRLFTFGGLLDRS
jgi:glycosyltransferase involved in cell wall biosynthesis